MRPSLRDAGKKVNRLRLGVGLLDRADPVFAAGLAQGL